MNKIDENVANAVNGVDPCSFQGKFWSEGFLVMMILYTDQLSTIFSNFQYRRALRRMRTEQMTSRAESTIWI